MTARLSPDAQIAHLRRGCVEIISEPELQAKLATGQPLVIKAGFDPTAPDLHLGHTVLLRKLRQFQDLGHKVIFLIGDATALVGDPSGQSKMRKLMTEHEVQANADTYLAQVKKILADAPGLLERRRNSEWFGKSFGLQELVGLTSRHTVARLIERDDFSKRMKAGQEVSMLEFFYPLMQGYDSVMLKADVEIGGTDQKFNLLVGRNLQRAYGQEPQVVMTTPLLIGLDGVQKMSKSLGNHIGINESPEEMFGKLMSVSDALMWSYFELLTSEDVAVVKQLHPMAAKKRLAGLVVTQYHGDAAAKQAQEHFERTVQQDETPAEVSQVMVTASGPGDCQLVHILTTSAVGATTSRGEARRMIEQGGVKVNGQVVRTVNHTLEPGRDHLIQFGKRLFRRVRLSGVTKKSKK